MDHPLMLRLLERYPELAVCAADIRQACEQLLRTYRAGGKMLLAGNGGSAADCDHVVGELMKGFMSKRRLPAEEKSRLQQLYGDVEGEYLADRLQGALPARFSSRRERRSPTVNRNKKEPNPPGSRSESGIRPFFQPDRKDSPRIQRRFLLTSGGEVRREVPRYRL